MKVLDSLEKSFNSSLRTSVLIEDSLSRLKNSIDSIAGSLSGRSPATGQSATIGGASNANKSIYLVNKFGDTIEHAVNSMESIGSQLGDSNSAASEVLEKTGQEASRDRKAILDKVIEVVAYVGRIANEFSQISNDLIKASGASGAEIRALRSDIVNGITTDLNRDTGGFFSPKDVYRQMADISAEAGIGNMETLKELTRPIMLAQESMNISTRDISVLLGRWHTRYSFSSAAMEDIVDDIRGSTANNQATAEATLENLAVLERWMSYYSGGDEDQLKEMSSAISKGTAWLESMHVDTSRYTEYIADIASGKAATNPQLVQVLNEVGLSALEAQKMFSEGNIERLYQALFEGETSVFKEMSEQGINLLEQASTARGMDVNDLVDAYNAAMAGNYTDLENFIETIDTASAAESVEDKYISATDRINNWLEKIYKVAADGQEILGVGLSDIAGLYVLFKGASKGIEIISKAAPTATQMLGNMSTGLIGSSGGAVAGGQGIAGLLSTAGPAIGIAAAVVGVAGVVNGLYDTYKEVNKIKAEGYTETESILANLEEGLVPGASKKITVDDSGKAHVSYEYGMNSEGTLDDALSSLKDAKSIEQKNLHSAYNSFGWEDLLLMGKVEGASGKKQWYDWIPMVGGLIEGIEGGAKQSAVNSKYSYMESLMKFIDGLSGDEKRLVSAYYSSGLLNDSDSVNYLINNFDKIYSLSESGLAVTEMSKSGTRNTVGRKELLGYASGTNYITRDQIAVLHEGEAVVPKKYNPKSNMNELELLREAFNRREERSSEASQSYLRESLSVLSEIKEFLNYWREDSIRRENTRETRSKFAAHSNYLSSYNTF